MKERPSNKEYFLLFLPITIVLFFLLAPGLKVTGEVTRISNQTNQTGNLFVISNPSGANLYVDNLFRGTTPKLVTKLSAGYYDVKISKSGYRDYLNNVYIAAGKTKVLNVTLKRINETLNQTGDIYVTSRPTNATLYVDNVFRGLTPRLVSGLSAWYHLVKVTKAGYYDYINNVHVKPGVTTTLQVNLTKIINQTK